MTPDDHLRAARKWLDAAEEEAQRQSWLTTAPPNALATLATAHALVGALLAEVGELPTGEKE